MKSRRGVGLILALSLIIGDCFGAFGAHELLAPELPQTLEEVPEEPDSAQEELEIELPIEETQQAASEETMLQGNALFLQESIQEGILWEEPEISDEEPEPAETMQPLQEQNESIFQEDMMDGEALAEAIESGEVLALSPAVEATAELSYAAGLENMPTAVAQSASGYKIIQRGLAIITDSQGEWANTGFRSIQYTDSTGAVQESPLYCLNASRSSDGVQGHLTPDNGYHGEAPVQEIGVLENALLQKILYFGYGGPGDITGTEDPTCSHIDWSPPRVKYAFTHYALSYVYSGDLAGVSLQRAEESGLMRFIQMCQSRKIPSFNDLTFSARNSYSDAAVSSKTSGRSITTKFTLYRSSDAAIGAKTGFTDGYQLSEVISISGSRQNSISITAPSDESRWKVMYWKSSSDYNKLGEEGALLSAPGSALKLYGGYCFRIIVGKTRRAVWNYNFSMNLHPVTFILISGEDNINFPQYNTEAQQDFGAFVYTDAPASMTLSIKPQPYGRIELNKISSFQGESVKGAKFELYAAQKIYSGYNLIYHKDEKITDFVMDSGNHRIKLIYPGKYYFVETAPPPGHKLGSKTTYSVTVDTASCTTATSDVVPVSITVSNPPVIEVTVSLNKVDSVTGESLKGASFIIDEWDGSRYSASTKYKLLYEEESGIYKSNRKLVWTVKNKGKFRVREIEAPAGYRGAFSREFTIGDSFPEYQEELFLGNAENEPMEGKRITIYKIDSETGEPLEEAEFTLYEWDGSAYAEKEMLIWDSVRSLYESSELKITEQNSGRYKVVETKLPDGYTGVYEEEFYLDDNEDSFYREAVNTPVAREDGTLSIIKKDSQTGEILEGAEFVLLEWNQAAGAYEDTLKEQRILSYNQTSAAYESGTLYWTEKNEGKFLVREEKNPEGYTGSFEQEFQIKKGQENTFTYTVYNEPDIPVGEITVIKRIKESDINWANGNPIFSFVAEGTDRNGIFHRYEDFVMFVNGEGIYEVDEQGYAILGFTFRNVPEGTYEVYEKETLRYYLADLTSASPNVSVKSSAPCEYGCNPKDSFTGIVSLKREAGRQTLQATLVFTNEKKRWDGFSHTDVVKNTAGNVMETQTLSQKP